MELEILTPENKLFEGKVYGVQLPGTDGLFELLDKHAPIVSALGDGEIKVIQEKDKTSEQYNISGGFVEMLNNKATVLVEKIIT